MNMFSKDISGDSSSKQLIAKNKDQKRDKSIDKKSTQSNNTSKVKMTKTNIEKQPQASKKPTNMTVTSGKKGSVVSGNISAKKQSIASEQTNKTSQNDKVPMKI